MTGVPPARVTMCGYMTKYGSKKITSSPGLIVQSRASTRPPLVPLVMSNFAVGMPIAAANVLGRSGPAARRCPG